MALLQDSQEGAEDCCSSASQLLHGCVRLSSEGSGWLRPWRFAEAQVRAVGSCHAWHPGLLRQMARTTSGITLEFETDATEVRVDVRFDAEPRGTSAVLGRVRVPGPHDSLSADIDGRHLGGLVPDGDELLLTVEDVERNHGQQALPGMGENHRVRVWLPALRGCLVRGVQGNGSYLRPVPEREYLLVLGDSIAQGFVTGDPALSWPARLARDLDLDLLNQSLGGQVFQPGTLLGLSRVVSPKLIVVALGENYRYEPCTERLVSRDVRNYLSDVARSWPKADIYVCTPLWHDEEASPSHALSCWQQVPSVLRANASAHDRMVLVDGQRLLDHNDYFLADADGHPNADGARQVAERLRITMLARKGTADERRARAAELLKRAPRRAFPLVEAARRGIGEFVLAEPGCVLFDAGDDQLLLYAPDHKLGRSVLTVLCDSSVLGLLEPGLLNAAKSKGGYRNPLQHHLAIYKRDQPPLCDNSRDIRVLDERYLHAVCEGYGHPEFVDERGVLERLRQGLILGGFEDGELVGFVGEHTEGSIGMLVVREDYRQMGWGYALMAEKIARTLARGWVPWCEVFPDNTVSLKLYRKLGMTITPAREQCYLMR